MTDTTTTVKKTPVASVALATGFLGGISSILLGYFDKTGLSRLLIEFGGASGLTALGGTFLHQIGLTKWGKDVETDLKNAYEDVEKHLSAVDTELTDLWAELEKLDPFLAAEIAKLLGEGATGAVAPPGATGATGVPA
jgi:hypothetical protein